MNPEQGYTGPRKKRRISPPESASYVLRPLLEKVPLAEDSNADIHITCVEYWSEWRNGQCGIDADSTDGNLYIGTSAAEILHFVCLSPDSDDSTEPSFILASRLPIAHSKNASPPPEKPGVQQIVLLPRVNKACILCNGTVTFYLMPELSPAFGSTKVSNCRWIGGLDLNADTDNFENPVVMIADQSRIMLVRIGDEARRIRNIQFPGCLVASCRGTIACVADTHAYSLLDVEHQQKIPLFPISSSNEAFESGHIEDIPPVPPPATKRSPSPSYPSARPEGHANESSTSLDTSSPQPDRSNSVTPDLSSETPRRSTSQERGENEPPQPQDEGQETEPAEDSKPLPPLPKQAVTRLKPHVLSPTSSEFLLVTGTEESEPGVGMFVNMDGDVVPRGTINFHRYPESVVIDRGENDNLLRPSDGAEEERVLAVVDSGEEGKTCKRLEVQRWDIDTGEVEDQKGWVEIPWAEDKPAQVGLRHTTSPSELQFYEMGYLLRRVRLKIPLPPHIPAADPRTQASIEQHQKEKELFESQESTDSDGSRKGDTERGWEAERNAEETRFARGLGKIHGSLVMWVDNQIWRVLRNPLTIQLDDALQNGQEVIDGRKILHRDIITEIMESVQYTEPKSEAEFVGLNYVKQKASLLLFEDLISMDGDKSESTINTTELALITGELDPRMVLLLVPLLQPEVLQGSQGIWIHAGLAAIAEPLVQNIDKERVIDGDVLDMVKRFLFSWQQKRGYGSIMDDTYVFDSVDAALLHLLLERDSATSAEQRATSSIRTELNRLVDNWKGNFDRAVTLLESYHRLFLLSRLYQSQKMSRNVLKTWQRIIEGENDAGGEVTGPGVEAQMRRYLAKIKDVQLVEEYGSWLAGRNPTLGIQVFADTSSRVQREPADVVALLKERAPNAVQEYLEHLVFAKNVSNRCYLLNMLIFQYTQYADDLISYYLDSVISVLESSPSARGSLAESYSTYRALRPPKPTYMNFITENAPPDSWWQSRIRLLQLLGGGSSTQFSSMRSANLSYSIPTILARIEPFQDELVSESIILDGLQGRHREALRLLTHGLGDYDSGVRYCLFGGPRSTSSTGPLAEFAEHSHQSELFKHLLDEFLHIQNVSERIERTSDLLARFASWFDVGEVLAFIPDDWSVDILSGFLAHVFRVLVSETREARIERALSASLNLRVGTEYIAGVEKFGGYIESPEGLRRLKDKSESENQIEWGDIVSGQ